MIFNIKPPITFSWRKHLRGNATHSKVKAGDNVGNVSGRDTIITTITHVSPVPAIQAEVYGSGARRMLQGKFTSKAGQQLVVLAIEINGVRCTVQQSFSRVIALESLPGFQCPPELFTDAIPNGDICLKVEYRTLDGQRYELTQWGKQERMATGAFNIDFGKFKSAPTIQPISED